MFKELDIVVLRKDDPTHRLQSGDVGTVVGIYPRGGYEVEFTGAEGDTIAVLTLADTDLRPMGRREILHVRDVDNVLSS